MSSIPAVETPLVMETTESLAEPLAVISPQTRKPRVWTAFVTFLLAVIIGQITVVVAAVAVGVVIGTMMGAQGADAAAIQARITEFCQRPLPALLLSLIPFQLGMMAVVLYATRRSKEPIKQRLGLVPQTGRMFGRTRLVRMAAFTVSAALMAVILSTLLIKKPPAQNAIGAAITDGSWWTITLLSIVLSIIPALVEESLFRGYLQRRFLERWSPAVAIGVSTLLFAVMHCDSPQHVVSVVPLGIVAGLLAYRTKSIKPGMLVHAAHNATVVGFGALTNALSASMSSEAIGLLVIGTIAVLFLIGLPAVISLLRRSKPVAAIQSQPAPQIIAEFLTASGRALDLPRIAMDPTAIDSRLAGTV